MPDELKIGRSYHEALRRLGIQNPGEVRIGTPVQLTASIDELSHLVPPILVTVAGSARNVGAVAGSVSGVQLESRGPGGCWVEAVASQDGTQKRYLTFGANQGDTFYAAVAPQFLLPLGAVPTAVFAGIQGTGLAAVVNDCPIGIQNTVFQMPFYLPPGTFFVCCATGVNIAATISIMWREVPVGAFETG